MCMLYSNNKNFFYYGMNVRIQSKIFIIEWMCVLYSNNKNFFIIEWMLEFNHKNFYYGVNVYVVFEQQKYFIIEWMLNWIRITKIFIMDVLSLCALCLPPAVPKSANFIVFFEFSQIPWGLGGKLLSSNALCLPPAVPKIAYFYSLFLNFTNPLSV